MCRINLAFLFPERRNLTTLGKEVSLTCNKCDWSTGSKTLLKKHMLRDHEDSQETPNLTTTVKETQIADENSEILPKETKKKYIPKRIKCEKCDKKFNKNARFILHMESVHNESPELSELSNKVTLPVKKRSLRNIKNRGTL